MNLKTWTKPSLETTQMRLAENGRSNINHDTKLNNQSRS